MRHYLQPRKENETYNWPIFMFFFPNYLSYMFKLFPENVFDFGQMFFFHSTWKIEKFPSSWFMAAS